MKAIAVLTMFFLPGTFLAALFAAPLFDWNSDPSSGGGIIKKRFWIYWVITIPATCLVLGCWRMWYRFEEWRSWNGEGGDLWKWIRGRKDRDRDRDRGEGRRKGDVEMVIGERWGSWGYEVEIGKEG
jgi:hypothetical protein